MITIVADYDLCGVSVDLLEMSRRAATTAVVRAQEIAKGHSTFAVLRQMEKEQWLPSEQLQHVQSRRLGTLIQTAHAHVPYYRDLFGDLHLNARDIRRAVDLQHIPFLTKDLIRHNLERMKNEKSPRLKKFSTGGSTGSPLVFFLGATRVSSDVAARIRAESWFGASITDPEFAIWGSPVELNKQDRLREIRDRVLRTHLLSAFEMNSETMTRYLDQIERQGCRRIFGYPSSIALLCEQAREQNRDLRKLGVKAVFVTAEYLYDHWRSLISETFGCPVANGYGGRDSGFVAHECPAGGMHTTADRLIVEIVDEHGSVRPEGLAGEIVVTNLDTPEMPFIRYRTGDVGTLSTRRCRCGRSLPLLERIDGRKTDFIVAPDGRSMHGLSLIYVLREEPGIAAFRITQKRLTQFEVEIVRDKRYDAASETRISEGFRRRLRAPVGVEIRYSESIPPTRSGKTRQVISEVSPPLSSGHSFPTGGEDFSDAGGDPRKYSQRR